MAWIRIVKGERTLGQELAFYGVVLYLVVAFVGLVWGGLVGWLLVIASFVVLTYIFHCVRGNRSVVSPSALVAFVQGLGQNPGVVLRQAAEGFDKYVKPATNTDNTGK